MDGTGGTGGDDTAGTPSGRPGARPSRWRRGRVLAGCAVLTAALLALHRLVPNAGIRLGSLLETFLPWLGLAVPVLLLAGLLRRSATALVALVLPVVAWLALFGPLLVPADGARHDLLAVQHNVADDNADPAGTARALARERPHLIALEEVTPAALPAYERALAPGWAHHAVIGTVGLWSRYPLTDVAPVDIRPRAVEPGWSRGLRATARTPHGDIAVYVAHLPSIRLGVQGLRSGNRDESARLLGAAIEAEPVERVLLLGDLNGTVDDRGLRPLTSRLEAEGPGFALSWPAGFPVARIDQVLARTSAVVGLRALPATGSDHLPVLARIRY
ncbi:endonuclease/exonuclease/phosphatase family protein [Streptomyces zhihengii]|uniref:Endonuclease/exonuclease/phosphatase family protein n=1 Tax=Streptomyces zhihengii TaxID=1818004 RepID=A0ABS2UIX5_9ACTN|nr:endonuclease/exonuclease/phosphatase family protein [Streptomyces zhihengii]MBM9617521.1 endonuclease/exonuclease/phosphatase family protein [Streptomyces zhihengii]